MLSDVTLSSDSLHFLNEAHWFRLHRILCVTQLRPIIPLLLLARISAGAGRSPPEIRRTLRLSRGKFLPYTPKQLSKFRVLRLCLAELTVAAAAAAEAGVSAGRGEVLN